jgi:C-terminal processing protease CtpA/Prc
MLIDKSEVIKVEMSGLRFLPAHLKIFASVLFFLLNFSLPAFAQEVSSLKADTPKMDMTAPERAKLEKVTPKFAPPKGPLKGGVERNAALQRHNLAPGKGRLDRNQDELKGQLQNQGLGAEIESGIGIIGVKFVMVFGRQPVINRVFPLTPAQKVGLAPNDIIVAVDGIPTVGLAKEEVYDMIVGSPGTPVTLSIERDGSYESVTMMRMDLNDITDPFVRRDYLSNM